MHRLRSAHEMHRSRDDRMVAGVCAGAARYLDVDPVIIRVVVAALTFVGGAGLVIYGAAWLLLPEEGSDHSLISDRLPQGQDEHRIRTILLTVAAVATIAITVSWNSWNRPFGGIALPWVGLVIGAFWFFVIRPHRRTQADSESGDWPAPPHTDPTGTPVDLRKPDAQDPSSVTTTMAAKETGTVLSQPFPAYLPRPPRTNPRGGATLLWFTVAVGLVVGGLLWLLDARGHDVALPDYVAAELAVVGIGTAAGIWVGNARYLLAPGVLLGLTLAVTGNMPSYNVGVVDPSPTSSAELSAGYSLGAGQLRLDLRGVSDLAALNGRTITLREGYGDVRVYVPRGLDMTVKAHTSLGDVRVFGKDQSGTDVHGTSVDPPGPHPDVTLVIDQNVGSVEVIRS